MGFFWVEWPVSGNVIPPGQSVIDSIFLSLFFRPINNWPENMFCVDKQAILHLTLKVVPSSVGNIFDTMNVQFFLFV